MRSSRQFSFNAQHIASMETSGPMTFWGGSGGNPDLDPWRANSADLSYELYFPEENGYFAVAVYYKDLDSWVFSSEQPFDYSPFVPFLVEAGFDPAVSTGPYSAPRNGQGGYIQGYEISLTINGGSLPRHSGALRHRAELRPQHQRCPGRARNQRD